ncbi:hypothetical protein ACFCV9_05070 [Streptomyces sp. NPDC056367]|uniref:hypothetical protein n=1 Tax=Streptomyces sp. NPDC056367 TaxID=3345797 RepID=UPI0035E055C9
MGTLDAQEDSGGPGTLGGLRDLGDPAGADGDERARAEAVLALLTERGAMAALVAGGGTDGLDVRDRAAIERRDTVAGAVRFAKAARATGVRPVFGVDVAAAP